MKNRWKWIKNDMKLYKRVIISSEKWNFSSAFSALFEKSKADVIIDKVCFCLQRSCISFIANAVTDL